MKNLIDFLSESRGQAIVKRSTNRPYSVENDELAYAKNTRPARAEELRFKKQVDRVNGYINEVNKFANDGGLIFESLSIVTVKNTSTINPVPICTLGPLNMDDQTLTIGSKDEFDVEVPNIDLSFSKTLPIRFLENQSDDSLYVGLEIAGDYLDYAMQQYDVDDAIDNDDWYIDLAKAISRQYSRKCMTGEEATTDDFGDLYIPLKEFNYNKLAKVVNDVKSKFWK